MGGRSKIWFFYPTWYAFTRNMHAHMTHDTHGDMEAWRLTTHEHSSAFPIALQAFVLLWRQLRYGKLTPPGT